MREKINFYDGFIQDDVLWFSNLNQNALMTLDIRSGKISEIGRFPGCKSNQKELHIRVIEKDQNLYFIPRSGSIVHVFSLKTRTFEDNLLLPYSVDTYVTNAFMDPAGNIWLIPAFLKDGIMVLNTDEKSVEPFRKTELLDELSECYIAQNGVCYHDGVIMLNISKPNSLISIDTVRQVVTVEKLDEAYCPYSFLSDDGEMFYFSNYPDHRIMSWNKKDHTYTMISDQVQYDLVCNLFGNYIRKGQKLICMPYDRNDLMIVDLSDGSQTHIPVCEYAKVNSVNPIFLFYREYQGDFYLFPSGADHMLIIDGEDLSVRTFDYRMDDKLERQIQEDCQEAFEDAIHSGMVFESIEYNDCLDKYINFLTRNDQKDGPQNRSDYGSQIHERVKKMMF